MSQELNLRMLVSPTTFCRNSITVKLLKLNVILPSVYIRRYQWCTFYFIDTNLGSICDRKAFCTFITFTYIAFRYSTLKGQYMLIEFEKGAFKCSS